MCKDALAGKQVNENLEGAERGGELGGSIQTMYSQPTEALDKAMEEFSTLRAIPRPQDQVCLYVCCLQALSRKTCGKAGLRVMDFRAESLLSDVPCGWRHVRHNLMAATDGIVDSGKCSCCDSCYYFQLDGAPTSMGMARTPLGRCLEKAASS